jgi:hypothetical protein
MIPGCLGRSGPHLAAYQRGAPVSGSAEGALLPPGRVPRSDFTSNKLAPKLAQQLKVGTTTSVQRHCSLPVHAGRDVCQQLASNIRAHPARELHTGFLPPPPMTGSSTGQCAPAV